MIPSIAKNSRKFSVRSTSHILARCYSKHTGVVDLHFEKIVAPSPSPISRPLLICHGLFGSKQNWRSLAKTFGSQLRTDVYALDLRNHGTSPHSLVMDYATMASDITHFCQRHNLTNISLMGHSMGGKVAMALALSPELPESLLSNLIVVDIAPSKGSLSSEFRQYVSVMRMIEQSGVSTRKEANEMLEAVEQDASIRAFLLTNLTFPEGGGPVKFRLPLTVIEDSLDDLGGFPYYPGEREWPGRTLFIKGNKSKYVNRHNISLAEKFFPNMRLESLDTGHWVHAEKPQDFVNLVINFTHPK